MSSAVGGGRAGPPEAPTPPDRTTRWASPGPASPIGSRPDASSRLNGRAWMLGDDYSIVRERDIHAVASARLEEGSTGLYL